MLSRYSKVPNSHSCVVAQRFPQRLHSNKYTSSDYELGCMLIKQWSVESSPVGWYKAGIREFVDKPFIYSDSRMRSVALSGGAHHQVSSE
jgi:hypothetical protein